MNIKKRLLIIWPGYRKYNLQFFQRLADDGDFDIRIIWIRNHREDDLPSTQFTEQIESTVVGANTIRVSGYRINTLYRLFFSIYKNILWCDAILTSTQAPVHSKVAYLYSRIFKKKLFIIIEQWKTLSKKSFAYRMYEKIGYHMMRGCNTLFVHGDNQKEFAIANGVDPKKVRILPFLSDDLSQTNITNPELSNQLSIQNKVVILYFGRITRRKGLKELLQAYRLVESEIPESILLICGGADSHFQGYEDDLKYQRECDELIRSLGKRVLTTGPISPELKQDYIFTSDIFIHPHSTEGDLYEGWGLILNEATSLSLPIITTDRVGAAKNLVIDGFNGYIIPAGDIQQLSERIKILVSNNDLRDKFSKNSRIQFEKYHKPDHITKEIQSAMTNGR